MAANPKVIHFYKRGLRQATSARELGGWVGRFFHEKFAANGQGLDDHERLSEMRAYSAAGNALGLGAAETYVLPRDKRPLSRPRLSAEAREKIAIAQRLRWKLAKRMARKNGGSAQHQKTKHIPNRVKPRGGWHANTAQRLRNSKGMSKFWSSMTPEQRSVEMKRRRALAQKNRANAA